MKFVNLWQWVYRARMEALQQGDARRLRMIELSHEAWRIFEQEPERALAMYTQGADLARQLGEPCWELYHEYWRCEGFLFYLHRIDQGLELAIKLAMLARKPAYERCPIRGRVYRVLVDAYLFKDALGYEEQIRENLDYMENEVPLDADTWQLVAGRRVDLEIDAENWDQAYEMALVYLSRCQTDFRLAGAYSGLCRICYERGNIDAVRTFAITGEQHIRRANRVMTLVVFQVWQAVAAAASGEQENAQRIIQSAQRKLATLGIKPRSSYYEALCAYYTESQQLDKLIAARREQIAAEETAGNHFETARIRVQLCEQLARMGALTDADLSAAQAAVDRLLKPEVYQPRLDVLR